MSVCKTYFFVFLNALIIRNSEILETSSELIQTSSELISTSSELILTGSELISTIAEFIEVISCIGFSIRGMRCFGRCIALQQIAGQLAVGISC